MNSNSVNIVIPMAGLGSRFAEAGYVNPKPFIDVLGMPMIERVLRNLNVPNAKYILIARKEHFDSFDYVIQKLKNEFDLEIIFIDKLTEGTACTVLFAYHLINSDSPLIIANSDQIVDININDYVNDNFEKNADGSILCFKDISKNPKWSFAKLGSDGFVTEVKEKQPISDLATVGIYMFTKGKYYCESAIEMIINNDRVNNEFYTCPVYNYMIRQNKKVITYTIDEAQMNGIGTPTDLEIYLKKISTL